MSSPDSNLIRQAVAQFQPRRRPRFQNLQTCRDFIIELREKGASCEAIAELLTRYGVKTSRTMVNEFVRTLFQKENQRRKSRLTQPAHETVIASPSVPPAQNPAASPPAKTRGPHIAKIELVKPVEQYD